MYYFYINDGTDEKFRKLKFKSLRAAKSWLSRGDKEMQRHLQIHEVIKDKNSKLLSFRGIGSKVWVNIEAYTGELNERFNNKTLVKLNGVIQ